MSETFSESDLEPSAEETASKRREVAERAAVVVAVLSAGLIVGGMLALGACAAPMVFQLTPAPFSGNAMGIFLVVEGKTYQSLPEMPFLIYSAVEGDYFQALGMRLQAGRFLGAQDTEGSLPVVVVNRTLARKHFEGLDPLGKRIKAGLPDNLNRPGILENSETVRMDGEVLTRGTDYSISYDTGQVRLLSNKATNPNGNLQITYAYTPLFARVMRAPVLAEREKEYVEAVRALGATRWTVALKHVLPNVLSPFVVQGTVAFSQAILIEASLSYLGLSAQPPTPSWGNMLNEGRTYLETAPWISVFPGIAIMTAVLAFNLIGDGLRDILDPTA